MAKYENLCKEILENIGGTENVTFATHCITRLRFNLADKNKVNQDAIKKINGVLGSQFAGEQFQVIIGQHVGDVYNELIEMSGIKKQDAVDENLDNEKGKFSVKEIPAKIMDYVSGSITPILPIIVASGIFKLFATLFGPSMLNLFPADHDFLKLCALVGDAGFYFYPIYLAWSAAKKLNTSIPLAMMLGACLIHPSFLSMVTGGETFTVYGLPVTMRSYASQFLPSILIVWVMSYVYKYLNKVTPNAFRLLIVPMGTLLIMLPISFCLLAPVGFYVGTLFGKICVAIYSAVGPLAVGLVGALWAFLVSTGMHSALATVGRANLVNLGYDNMIFPGANIGTYSLIGLSLAYILRGPKEERATAVTNSVSQILGGVGEPVIFGTLLRYKSAIIAQLIGGFAGGVVAGLFKAKITLLGATNFLIFLGFGEDLVKGLIACLVGGITTFVIAMILGFNDKKKA